MDHSRLFWPTPYPEINTVLEALRAGVEAVLGQHFIGLYLHGSLASGDFNLHRSDIDFLVVTAGELREELLPDLQAMHARLAGSGGKWAAKLEGSYIPRPALRRYEPEQAWHPALRIDGSFGVDQHASDWVIQRHLIREFGLVISGPPPRSLIDPVPRDALRRAARAILEEWWSPMLNDTTRLQSSEYQAYTILTMCRALYTIQQGRVLSKPNAARWAQQALGEHWATWIERALAWHPGVQLDNLDETLQFIQYTLDQARQLPVVTDGD